MKESIIDSRKVYFGLGSNLGEREKSLLTAIGAIEEIIGITKVSSIYETEPWDVEGQNYYLNMVIESETDRDLQTLFYMGLEIEHYLGRKRENRWEPRTIDVDILIAGDEIAHTSEIIVPHPSLHLRNFVLVPFAEIVPDMIHPILYKSVRQLMEESIDECSVTIYKKSEELFLLK